MYNVQIFSKLTTDFTDDLKRPETLKQWERLSDRTLLLHCPGWKYSRRDDYHCLQRVQLVHLKFKNHQIFFKVWNLL